MLHLLPEDLIQFLKAIPIWLKEKLFQKNVNGFIQTA